MVRLKWSEEKGVGKYRGRELKDYRASVGHVTYQIDSYPHTTCLLYRVYCRVEKDNGNETVLHILDTRQLRHAKGYCQLDADKMERAGTLTAS